MLSLENRETNDFRFMGELFLYFSDEMADITWIQAFQMMLQMFRILIVDQIDISDEKIDELVASIYGCTTSGLENKIASSVIQRPLTTE
uniref:hypothetical protein n=1 Tax=Cellulosilyticum ruminicola TaxID=425254 RepID=UPI001FA6F3D9|nr:hypothetical protein [Cellulosilyticum ruminicola]